MMESNKKKKNVNNSVDKKFANNFDVLGKYYGKKQDKGHGNKRDRR